MVTKERELVPGKTEMSQTFANALERLMKQRGLTVSELARRTDMPRSTVHRHLKGGRPIRDSIATYARVLEFPESDLLMLAGFRAPDNDDREIMALANELRLLDSKTRELLWQMVGVLRRQQ